MKKMLVLLLLMPVSAQSQGYCNRAVPYDVVKSQYGYSILMSNRVDYCIEPIHENDDKEFKYVCLEALFGDTYRLNFVVEGDKLYLDGAYGRVAEFQQCENPSGGLSLD